ncbi:MAG: Transaldolase [Chlamydiae bacterium]|nr:Transaldolase [Chlamydiota bacterium]
MSKLEQLKKITTVVCDTGDINSIKKYEPTDATTNPSLIFQAAQEEQYQYLIDDAIRFGMHKTSHETQMLHQIMDKLFVNFGVEILKIVPGRVSTEVDARLSFDVEGSIHKATTLIGLYENAGIDRSRVLIKLASTWEGVQAAKVLEKEGIHCNMTLMFSLPQAIACAEAKATLISPFVGRIFDWYKASEKVEGYPPEKDPGVLSVSQIYNYYKKYGYETQVMGASFRNVDEILELAGCDLLTIAPKFLELLAQDEGSVSQKLSAQHAKSLEIEKMEVDESAFHFQLNDNAMAIEKLSEGIRKFAADTVKLEHHILDRVSAAKA